MNQVLTPFSYAFAETGDILDLEENNVAVKEIVEEEPVDEDIEEVEQQEIEDTQNDENDLNNNLGSELITDQDWIWDAQNDVNNNPGSELMTGQNLNSEQNENDVEPGLNWTWNAQAWSGLDSQQAGQTSLGSEWQENGTGDVNDEIDYSKYTSETRVAVLVQKLGIDWEEDAQYYANLAWIDEEYLGTAEQNEKIRLFLLDNLEGILNGEFEEVIAEMKENTDDNTSEWLTGTWNAQAWSELDSSTSSQNDASLSHPELSLLCQGEVETEVVEEFYKGSKIIYVSCNPATLARDLKYLMSKGCKIESIQPFDMFCHTNHVETVAIIEV